MKLIKTVYSVLLLSLFLGVGLSLFNTPVKASGGPVLVTFDVTVDTNGVLLGRFTNFFEANITNLLQAIGTNSGPGFSLGFLENTNGNMQLNMSSTANTTNTFDALSVNNTSVSYAYANTFISASECTVSEYANNNWISHSSKSTLSEGAFNNALYQAISCRVDRGGYGNHITNSINCDIHGYGWNVVNCSGCTFYGNGTYWNSVTPALNQTNRIFGIPTANITGTQFVPALVNLTNAITAPYTNTTSNDMVIVLNMASGGATYLHAPDGSVVFGATNVSGDDFILPAGCAILGPLNSSPTYYLQDQNIYSVPNEFTNSFATPGYTNSSGTNAAIQLIFNGTNWGTTLYDQNGTAMASYTNQNVTVPLPVGFGMSVDHAPDSNPIGAIYYSDAAATNTFSSLTGQTSSPYTNTTMFDQVLAITNNPSQSVIIFDNNGNNLISFTSVSAATGVQMVILPPGYRAQINDGGSMTYSVYSYGVPVNMIIGNTTYTAGPLIVGGTITTTSSNQFISAEGIILSPGNNSPIVTNSVAGVVDNVIVGVNSLLDSSSYNVGALIGDTSSPSYIQNYSVGNLLATLDTEIDMSSYNVFAGGFNYNTNLYGSFVGGTYNVVANSPFDCLVGAYNTVNYTSYSYVGGYAGYVDACTSDLITESPYISGSWSITHLSDSIVTGGGNSVGNDESLGSTSDSISGAGNYLSDSSFTILSGYYNVVTNASTSDIVTGFTNICSFTSFSLIGGIWNQSYTNLSTVIWGTNWVVYGATNCAYFGDGTLAGPVTNQSGTVSANGFNTYNTNYVAMTATGLTNELGPDGHLNIQSSGTFSFTFYLPNGIPIFTNTAANSTQIFLPVGAGVHIVSGSSVAGQLYY